MFIPRRSLIALFALVLASIMTTCLLLVLLVRSLVGPDFSVRTIARRYSQTRGYPEVVYVPNYTSGPHVTAASAILMESRTGTILYAKNEHQRRPPASTTKIMTAILAIEHGDLDSIVTVSRRAASIGGSSLWLRPGDKIRLEDLLRGIMLRSGNDGCVAIAEHIAGSEEAFVEMMNVKAWKLGAWHTQFRNPHGLHHPAHYSSAFDLALMARYGLKYPKFAEIVRTKEAEIELGDKEKKEKRLLANTNSLLWSFEGADGVKTGTTSAAGYCLVASATRKGCQFISVVLNSAARWSDSARLLEYAFNEFDVVPVVRAGKLVVETPVAKGMKRDVPLLAARDLDVIIRKKERDLLQQRVILDENIEAPIRKGSVVGRLAVIYDADEIAWVNLIAGEDVARRTPLRVFWEKVKSRPRRPGQGARPGLPRGRPR
ncbi:MAG TPA: D-alanyl-D-alanine carboxypeptidase [Firmicutes bacterium]|nr:D-alanyl-D-alanine carboxypeptidase [Bacillota bacterium]